MYIYNSVFWSEREITIVTNLVARMMQMWTVRLAQKAKTSDLGLERYQLELKCALKQDLRLAVIPFPPFWYPPFQGKLFSDYDFPKDLRDYKFTSLLSGCSSDHENKLTGNWEILTVILYWETFWAPTDLDRISLPFYSIRALLYFLRELFLTWIIWFKGIDFNFFDIFESSLLNNTIKIKWRGEFWRAIWDDQNDKAVELAKLIFKLTATPRLMSSPIWITLKCYLNTLSLLAFCKTINRLGLPWVDL